MGVLIYRNILNQNIQKFSVFLKKIAEKYKDDVCYIYSAKKQDFIQQLPNYNIVIICSHGSCNAIYHRYYNNTQKEHQILIGENNVALLRNKCVIAFSCATAQSLGGQAVEQGCSAYLGFKRKIHFERKNQDTSIVFYEKIRECYMNVFYRVLDYIFANRITIGQARILLKHELSKEAISICNSYKHSNPVYYNKYYISEIITTIANVGSNIIVIGNNDEILAVVETKP